MHLGPWDFFVFVAFFAAVVGLGLWKSRKKPGAAEAGSDGFFLAGRGLTWPLIGISIVAANISTEQMVGMAGQAAGGPGLAVSAWQLMGSVFIVVVAFTLLPRFLRAGIYTMPEFLEYRYNAAARGLMAALTVVIYAGVMLPAVLYSGGVALRAITGMELGTAVWVIGLLGAGYAGIGGLAAIAWADLVQGLALLAAGLLIFVLGLNAVGGWEAFAAHNADRLHMVLPASHPELPWTSVVGGMWIVMIYYCGLNQFIVQRNLAARSLRDGQLGMVFAGGLWLLVPFAMVMPGLLAGQLYAEQLAGRADAAFPTMVTQLIPSGLRGFVYAAIAGAVTSTLASLLSSASTIATMDLYRSWIAPGATQARLVRVGRIITVACVLIGCGLAPMLDDPKFGGVFNYIQQFQGYIWPGVVAAFLGAFLLPRAPAACGVVALVLGPVAYGVLQATEGAHGLHFLIQVLVAFGVVAVVMGAMTWLAPLKEARVLPVKQDIPLQADPVVKWAGAAVIAGVAAFFVVFW
jgi:SSS family solute:Na+ symporter